MNPILVPNGYIYEDISEERARQERLREEGRFKETCASATMPDLTRLAVLAEEFGEVARAVLEQEDANDKHGKDLRKELVQVAAVAVAWIEGLDFNAR
jgi:NTP pyrophosphatase (non-canonical NTP hydrolase)